VALYGNVYDVTEFLPHHPGGSKIILQLAGKDATEEYDPIHPPGTLEENLKPEAKLGKFIPPPPSLEKASAARADEGPGKDDIPPPLESLLNLDELEAEATKRISKKCWSYYYSAGDDLFSKGFNNHVYRQILLRPRVFVDCTHCDMSTTLLGHHVGMPLYVSPAAMARLAHPDGENGIARAAARFGAMQVVSNNASMTPEQIIEGSPDGQIFGWQLYVQTERAKSIAMLKRINAMRDRYKFICLTLDAPVPGKREHDEKSQFAGSFTVSAAGNDGHKSPGSGGVGQQLFWGTASDLTWRATLAWLAEHTDLPIVLKGLQTHEDAYLAAQYAPQVRAIILSNHGGRALDTAPPAVHTLMEIRKYCPEVFGKIEVWVDGGIKRGTDVVKALCLGAKAVGIGRAALFGLGAGGQAGVERTLESESENVEPFLGHSRSDRWVAVLKAEIDTCMRLLGARTVADLGPRFVSLTRRWPMSAFGTEEALTSCRGRSTLGRLRGRSSMVRRDWTDTACGRSPKRWSRPNYNEPTVALNHVILLLKRCGLIPGM
jgi:isopentenyl diphosphate isomerase/L-lactate dehydrogenase-like FMN-dependent dehydrogenase